MSKKSYGDVPKHIIDQMMAAPAGAAQGILERWRREQAQKEKYKDYPYNRRRY